ncbi:Membrane transport protein - like 10 [Theobroma cacao]|nr:Membrane transport protein - like 10 [Theobroma cacao]
MYLTCREAAIPCMTLIMGANLLKETETFQQIKKIYEINAVAGLKRSEVSMLVIIGIVAVRNIFLPLSGIGVVKAAHHFGMVGSDSLYRFVLMLQYAVPPAMSVGTMTQLFQSGQGESSMIMLWTYAVASISLTLWSMLFMWLLS